jgi:hypothetical protein
MSDIHHWLLSWLGPVGLLCASCTTTTTSEAMNSGGRSSREELVIDLSAGRATAAGWASEIVDCSNQDYFCLLIPNRMVLAFPRSCGDLIYHASISTSQGNIIGVAPAPHLAPPSGGYFISSFPNVLLYYNINFGLQEARIVRHSPYDHDFDPNDYSERYAITTSTGDGLFICSL